MASSEARSCALEERDWLLLARLAREAIRAQLQGLPEPSLQDFSTALAQQAGVFVTLYHDGKLRGCVGSLAGDAPLYRSVPRLAVAAAFEDFRFPPVTQEELEDLTIEISVLSPLQRIWDPEEIVLGVHGVVLSYDGHRAVFLPKVAVEQGWNRQTLLEELCRKAGLPGDAWKRPGAELFVFTVRSYAAPPEKQRQGC